MVSSEPGSAATTPDPLPLIQIVLDNLRDQLDWTLLEVHPVPSKDKRAPSRQFISGLPPRRIYMHPDEQVQALRIEQDGGSRPPQPPEFEWILPVFLVDKWSLSDFAAVFDSIATLPRPDIPGEAVQGHPCAEWRGARRQKRIILAAVHSDSTVTYYLIHDGIVKPRQN